MSIQKDPPRQSKWQLPGGCLPRQCPKGQAEGRAGQSRRSTDLKRSIRAGAVACLSSTDGYFTKWISLFCIWKLLTCRVGLVVYVAKKLTSWALLKIRCKGFFSLGVSKADRAWILDSSWCLDLPRPLDIYKCENSEMKRQEVHSSALWSHQITRVTWVTCYHAKLL